MRALLLLLAVALFTGCATNDDAGDDGTSATPTSPTANMTAKAMSVSLFDRTPGVDVPPTTMGITPAQLDLKVGEKVNLTVTNDGASAHDLIIEGLDVATESIAPGESFSVEFTPTEAGTYKMYCSVGGATPVSHDMQGMHGDVVVA